VIVSVEELPCASAGSADWRAGVRLVFCGMRPYGVL
jgi:hypothetical protein